MELLGITNTNLYVVWLINSNKSARAFVTSAPSYNVLLLVMIVVWHIYLLLQIPRY